MSVIAAVAIEVAAPAIDLDCGTCLKLPSASDTPPVLNNVPPTEALPTTPKLPVLFAVAK